MVALTEEQIKNAIKGSAWKNIISFTYTDSKGNKKTREAEVYDVEENHFYGHDLAADGIRTFKFVGVSQVLVKGGFKPRAEYIKQK